MPGWLTGLMKLLPGLTIPIIYAALTYGFFLWLDKKASGPARKAISGWLMRRDYDEAAVRVAILEVFDQVYTRPLLTWRASRRSALITVCVTATIIYQFAPSMFYIHAPYILPLPTADLSFIERIAFGSRIVSLLAILVTSVISDYVALFFVRSRLDNNRTTTFAALMIGPGMGLAFVSFCFVVRAYGEFLFYEVNGLADLTLFVPLLKTITLSSAVFSAGALLVHMWLPLFALCVGLLKGLNYLLLAANTAQWFLKRGKVHPLEAVGFVAAPLMFFCAAAVQWLWK
jgi:hypothetical protein